MLTMIGASTISASGTRRFVSRARPAAIVVGKLDDSSLIVKRLGTTADRLFAAPSYLERRGKPRAIADLATGTAAAALGPRVFAVYGGTALLVGLAKVPQSLELANLVLREITIYTTVAHICADDLPRALDLLSKRPLAELLVDRVVPLDGVVADAGQIKTYGELVRSEGRRLSEMVEQILEFAGIQSGQRRFEPGPGMRFGISPFHRQPSPARRRRQASASFWRVPKRPGRRSRGISRSSASRRWEGSLSFSPRETPLVSAA